MKWTERIATKTWQCEGRCRQVKRPRTKQYLVEGVRTCVMCFGAQKEAARVDAPPSGPALSEGLR